MELFGVEILKAGCKMKRQVSSRIFGTLVSNHHDLIEREQRRAFQILFSAFYDFCMHASVLLYSTSQCDPVRCTSK